MYTVQQQLMQILILIFVLNYFEEGKKTSWLLFMNKFQLSQSYSHFTETLTFGVKYSRMDQLEFVEDSL